MPVSIRTTETWHLNRIRELYADGLLTTTRLEQAIEHVLRGGYIAEDLTLKAPIMERVRALRTCRSEGHDLIDITQFGDQQPRSICCRCGTVT